MLRIGELAALAGVSVKTVRYYERVGILAPQVRTAAGYRLYDAYAAVVLIRARQLAEFGIPLVRVRDLLDTNTSSDVIDELLRARQRVDATFESLRRRRAALEALIDTVRAASAWPDV